jgi:hypothetical protein
MISWFLSLYEEMIGITKTHINPVYKEIFLRDKDTDVQFIKELIKKYTAEKVESFRVGLINKGSSFMIPRTRLACGYKMIPLNIKEVQDPLKLKYKPWREYLISNRLNDLIINSIFPGVSYTLDWFYIKNSQKGLYDNKSQFDRMKHSELAKDILHTLYEAQRSTYFAAENLDTMNKTSDDIKKWVSSKFRKLSEKIDDPISYSIEEIIMSEVTFAFASEYVGRTIADSFTLMSQSKRFNASLGAPLSDAGYDYFAKYIFEICYGLLCLNTKTGIIHGDFHLNNATIGTLYYNDPEIMLNKNKKYKVAYILDNENQYVFPNNCNFACIIDFSRSIIHPDNIDLFHDRWVPSTYKLVKNEDKFRSNESNSLLNIYIQMFPNKIRQKEELIVLFKNYFDAVFKLLTCIDLYMFTIRVIRLMKQLKMEVSNKAYDLIAKINKLSETYVASEMNALINNSEEKSKEILEGEWPILSIIKKCFPEYNGGGIYKDIGIINDMYIYGNEMKYSTDTWDMFPEFMTTVKYNKDGKLTEIKDIASMRKQNVQEMTRVKMQNLEMMNYIAIRHMEKVF